MFGSCLPTPVGGRRLLGRHNDHQMPLGLDPRVHDRHLMAIWQYACRPHTPNRSGWGRRRWRASPSWPVPKRMAQFSVSWIHGPLRNVPMERSR